MLNMLLIDVVDEDVGVDYADCDYVSFERASEFSTMLFFNLMLNEKKFYC